MLYGRRVKGPLQILRQLWTREQADPEVRTIYQYGVDLRNRLEKNLGNGPWKVEKTTTEPEAKI